MVHKNGIDCVRTDISKLIKELSNEFEVVRSSTIANLSAVRSFQDGELFFEDGSSCLCGKKYISQIMKLVNKRVFI